MIDRERRRLLRAMGGGAGLLALQGLMPAWAQSGTGGLRAATETLSGPDIQLRVGHSPFTVGGRTGHAITVNGTVPAPLIRLREGQTARLSVTNTLDEDTSIHWHGVLLPFQMDGVPGISFPGIAPGETFNYEFPVIQSGTFWYHSHSNLQEAMGHYGPLVIDPAGADPVAYDREHVLVLADWSFLHPHEILDRLKKSPGYFNRSRTTLSGLISGEDGMSLEERRMWGAMRMDPRDIADVNGTTYTYLINGHGVKGQLLPVGKGVEHVSPQNGQAGASILAPSRRSPQRWRPRPRTCVRRPRRWPGRFRRASRARCSS